jgi:hypothetical protein
VFGGTLGNEAGKRMDCCQPLIAGSDRAAALTFEVHKKASDQVRRQILDCQPINGLAGVLCREGHQEPERVAVAVLRVAGEISLADQMLD